MGTANNICQPYLDDNLVQSKSFNDHVQHICTALKHYQQHSIKLTPKKCELFRANVRFLGGMVSKDGYSVVPAEVAAIQALKE